MAQKNPPPETLEKLQPRGTRSSRTSQIQHHCQVCKSDRSPWMCVLCGQVHCGRYVNSHARKHFLNDNQHFLAICCHSRAAFCYACDDYVINDTQSKCIVRALEQFQNNQTSTKTNKRKDIQPESGLSPSTKDNLKAKRIRLAGIRNLGNTCYMNSVLQCLSHIQRFTSSVEKQPGIKVDLNSTSNGSGTHKRKLMQLSNVNANSKPELLIETLRSTIYLLKKSGKSCIIPESLFSMIGRNPRFRGYQQQDAHEFLRYVLDRLDKECLENYPDSDDKRTNNDNNNVKRIKKDQVPKSGASIIGNIFGGILQNEVNCLECGFKSHKQDPFMDLSLDIPSPRAKSATVPHGNNSDNSSESPDQDSSNTNGGTCHLIDCLSSFIELEELTETELYYCSNCQKKQRSTKRFWIRKLPDVLCLHLKRFRYNNFIRTKIDDYIQFPIQGLDMKRFVMANKHETRGSSCGPTTYDLVAFIEHHGSGVGSGHYTAYCRHEDYWFHFDDSSVTACDESTVRRSKAYILFYNKRS
uniref:Ubiquitin carboxyl-terminal hydrolase n=1 Tax=Aceria tosichella TaxID=561515 RepID=A0A6G1SCE3_9ACAR